MDVTENRIVADGPERYRASKNYWAVRRRVLDRISERYAQEKKTASFWRRVWLEVKISREVAEEMKKEFHPANLHAAFDKK
ncbi:MAG: hypothetical protein Q7S40_10295 [Opitutaceae bacterium]|nr:hypothetical protein [Opitutaceae bacterium]